MYTQQETLQMESNAASYEKLKSIGHIEIVITHPKHGRGRILSSKASFYPIRVLFGNGVKGSYTKQFSTHVGIQAKTLTLKQ